jgi:hypothetical protein
MARKIVIRKAENNSCKKITATVGDDSVSPRHRYFDDLVAFTWSHISTAGLAMMALDFGSEEV